MNANFKPLGLAAAVATATAGYAGVANAQSYASATELGDLAIVPYYTVMEGYATGVNIINTADKTQVIKFRFRRATDSMDALDFNVVLSPNDMYTGFLSTAGDDIIWTSNDNSCSVPAMQGNTFTMPGIYRADAETGYIEIISMGSPVDEAQNIAVNAKHDADGMPADCDAVRDNFFNIAIEGDKGVTSPSTTDDGSTASATNDPVSTYEASPDSLKVSYFIKSDETGVEFGDNAVHVAGFLDVPAITNQQTGIFSEDPTGFDYPDLNGGVPTDPASRGRFNELRSILGADELINDWSANSAGDFTVDTDWVITYPGQYTMLDLPVFFATLGDCVRPADNDGVDDVDCDYRDIPMTATITVYDREEQEIVVESGELVVSPQPPVDVVTLELPYEVNVIQWGESPVLNAPVAITGLETPPGSNFGWASLVTEPADDDLQVCDVVTGCAAAEGSAAVVGFVAWQRAFASLPAANYGRIVEHSRVQSSS